MSVKISATPKEGRYLTFMYRKQVEEGRRVTTTILAKSFKVNPATVTEILQKLAEKELVEYTRYYGAELTERGVVEAQKLLRKHRILEVLFVKFLRYDAEKACEEASKIDYYCSEDLINTICRNYGHPDTCPCNKKIFRDLTCMRG
ncbi:MAG: metal-dependent transcriptional regulator [Candidatus Bathyarchaeales archaeon]